MIDGASYPVFVPFVALTARHASAVQVECRSGVSADIVVVSAVH
jgi:hypothetical protein